MSLRKIWPNGQDQREKFACLCGSRKNIGVTQMVEFVNK